MGNKEPKLIRECLKDCFKKLFDETKNKKFLTIKKEISAESSEGK